MKLGKLDEKQLIKLLKHLGADDPAVILPPRFGEDAGVIRLGEQNLVVASDPITLASAEVGWYAVHINANDVAATGADPRWFLSTILLPEASDEDLAEHIFSQIDEACSQLGVSIVGGHTEVTRGLTRPLVCGTMLGTTQEAKVLPTGGAQIGDVVVMTKTAGLEGTALIAMERATEARYILGDQRWGVAKGLLKSPGISIVHDARIARQAVPVHAMHDPTEGGLCAGVYELARAAELGVEVDEDKVPIRPDTEELCRRFDFEPLRILASGSLLVCVAPEDEDELLRVYSKNHVQAATIGRMMDKGFVLLRKGLRYPLVYAAQDQLTRILQADLL